MHVCNAHNYKPLHTINVCVCVSVCVYEKEVAMHGRSYRFILFLQIILYVDFPSFQMTQIFRGIHFQISVFIIAVLNLVIF